MENKLRLRFSKTDTLRFIGHLDFLRVFMQTIRRSGLPVAYSQGFNPHQIISFALPLSLGMESVHDYADITLTEEIPYDEICSSINAVAPRGLKILDAYKSAGPAAAAATIAADYCMPANGLSQEKMQEVLAAETLVIPKKTKSGIRDTDIRPDIYSLNLENGGEILKMRISAGSAKFLNPSLVLDLLFVPGEKPCVSSISRLELYKSDGNGGFTAL